jgi:hypothetical protein
MTTFIVTQPQYTITPQPQVTSYAEGPEGKALNQRIIEVGQAVQKDESMRRLIQVLEKASKKRQQELENYLDTLRSEARAINESEFTVEVINYAWQVWLMLSNSFLGKNLCLEVPDACPGQDDNFMYTWSRAEHYLECEIFGSGSVEFFYRNRSSSENWGEDITVEDECSAAILEKVALFAW